MSSHRLSHLGQYIVLFINHLIFIHIDGFVKTCGNSSASALELPQSCTKPSIYPLYCIVLFLVIVDFTKEILARLIPDLFLGIFIFALSRFYMSTHNLYNKERYRVMNPEAYFTGDFTVGFNENLDRWYPVSDHSITINIAYALTEELSCHVQNFVAISLPECGWIQNVISVKFELRLKYHCQWDGPQDCTTIWDSLYDLQLYCWTYIKWLGQTLEVWGAFQKHLWALKSKSS